MFSKIRFPMSGKESQRWERIRGRGEVLFVLISGVLAFGGFVFVFSTCSAMLIFHRHLDAALVAEQALTCLVVGFFFGVIIWYLEESRYRARQESINHEKTSA